MMRVKAVAHVLGLEGYNFVPGDIFDLPDDKANDIIARNWAVPYAPVKKKSLDAPPIEAAVMPPTQYALSKRGSRGRFVKSPDSGYVPDVLDAEQQEPVPPPKEEPSQEDE